MSDTSMPVVLLEWKPVRKNNLRGFAKVRLGRSLVIHDIPVSHANGRSWAVLPGKPMTDRSNGMVMLDAKGKPRYSVLLEWEDDGTRNRFSTAVVEAVTRAHGPLDGDAR